MELSNEIAFIDMGEGMIRFLLFLFKKLAEGAPTILDLKLQNLAPSPFCSDANQVIMGSEANR